jgi:tRNA (cmo5U34)-methyltransferase
MAEVQAIFDAHAGQYDDAARRRLVPPFDAFYDAAVAALGLSSHEPRRVLDLGAGTGLLSGFVHAAYPRAELVLLDGAARMLEQARTRLGEENVAYVVGDMAEALPAGPFDAVVSSLAIHHLEDPAKRSLFGRVFTALVPGGVFVNAEQVLGASARFTAFAGAWHESRARAAGSSEEEWAATRERMRYDRCATVEDQLAWMRAAGFDADCLFKDHHYAVLVGVR